MQRTASTSATAMRKIQFLAALLLLSLGASAQTPPSFSTCTYDNTNGLTGPVSMGNPYEIPQAGSFTVTPGSVSGTDGLYTVTISSLKNVSGYDYSDMVLLLTDVGFWSQSYFDNDNYKFNWNPGAKWWTKTSTDGTLMTIRLYSVSINGASAPSSQIHMVPVAQKSATTAYSPILVQNASELTRTDQFYDGGTGITHTAGTLIPSLPANYIGLDFGPLANGQTVNNIVITFAVSFADGRNPFVIYSGDWGSNDIDYHVYNADKLVTYGYDYGDAPASYGIARHAPHATNTSSFCPAAGPIFIGPGRPDYELFNNQNASCNGDDTATNANTNVTGYDDETAALPDYTGDVFYSITVPYVNNSGTSGTLATWIDWNANGVFDASEKAQVTVPTGSGNATLTWRKTAPGAGEGTLAASLTTGSKVVRMRIGTLAAEIGTPTGTASDGEVEDKLMTVVSTVPLPVTLTSFTGARNGNSDLLSWITASEQGTSLFNVEYSSDGALFSPAGSVTAAGNSNESRHYQLTHNNVTGTAYYRLKTLYQDGTSAYSPVIRIAGSDADTRTGSLSLGTVYPVPFRDGLVLNINSGRETTATISLFTLSGNKVAECGITLSTGLASYMLPGLGFLPQGMYILKVQTNTDVLTTKVVK